MFPEFIIEMKRKFLSNVTNKIQPVMNEAKKVWNMKFQSRADYKSIFIQKDYDDFELQRYVLKEFVVKVSQVILNKVEEKGLSGEEQQNKKRLVMNSGFDLNKMIDFYDTDNADKFMIIFRMHKLQRMAEKAE